MTTTGHPFAVLAERVRALPPSCGLVRVVAVDGPSGAGKSTFAAGLARTLGRAPVVGSDEFPVPWDGDPLTWWGPLAAQVLEPLAAGRPGAYRRYDWRSDSSGGRIEIPVCPVLLLEGVGAAWRESPAAFRIWVDAPRELRRLRAVGRDGARLAESWERWTALEEVHFAADRTRDRADLFVDGAANLAGPAVFTPRSGAAGAPAAGHGDGRGASTTAVSGGTLRD